MTRADIFEYTWSDIDFDEEFLNLDNILGQEVAALAVIISLDVDLRLNYLALTDNGKWFHYIKRRYDFDSRDQKYAGLVKFISRPGHERSARILSFPKDVDGIDIEEICPKFMYHNNNIVAVKLPDKVKYIHELAFFQCEQLEEVVIPNSLIGIGKSAFMNCGSLQQIMFPEGMEVIEGNAFWSCSKLKRIRIPKSVRKIGYQAFKNCNLGEVLIKGQIEEVGQDAFEGNHLKRLSIWSDQVAHIAKQEIDGFILWHSGVLELSFHNCVLDDQIVVRCAMEFFNRIVCILTGDIGGIDNLPHNYNPLTVITNESGIRRSIGDNDNFSVHFTNNVAEEREKVIGAIINGKRTRKFPFRITW